MERCECYERKSAAAPPPSACSEEFRECFGCAHLHGFGTLVVGRHWAGYCDALDEVLDWELPPAASAALPREVAPRCR